MKGYDCIVIGGGAAGLYAAFHAGRRGRRALVLERANRLAKKVLMSGGGRCNFTHLHTSHEHFISANPQFCRSALARHTPWHFVELVDAHGIAHHEKAPGQLFCDESSKQIAALLRAECDASGVDIRLRCETEQVTRDGSGADWRVATDQGTFSAPTLIVASGGLSVPSLGGSDFGYRLAEQLGHRVLPLRAGLVPFSFTDAVGAMCRRMSGVAFESTLASARAAFREPALFTHRGLSGPAALQLSSYWQPGESITVDLLPDSDAPAWLREQKRVRPKMRLRRALCERLPRALAAELEAAFWPSRAELPLGSWPDRALDDVGETLAAWRLRPAGTEGYRTAEVTLGGVDTATLSSRTLMSQRHDGLYFIGEVVDVTGHLGGHNFQWAWSSAWAAAQAV